MAPPFLPDPRLDFAPAVSRFDAAGQRSLFDLWEESPPAAAPPPASPTAAALAAGAPGCPPAPPGSPWPSGGGRLPGGPPLRVVVLGSGSGGNAMLVESGEHRILIDAGFSSRELGRRLALVGVDPASLSALVLTHEHVDHCRGVARFARRCGLQVFGTAGTLSQIKMHDDTAQNATVLRSGVPCEVAGFQVEPFLIPHDAREPIGAVITDAAGRRIGLVADCGSRSQLAWARLRELDILVLETNHDLDMLRNGPYPWPLKQRVAGRHGHLSNREAAEGLPELLCDRLSWVVLYHLSRTNNLPALAAATLGETLAHEGSSARLQVTGQFQPSAWLEVS